MMPESGVSWGDLINAYEYLKGRSQVNGVRFFSVVPRNRIKSNGHKIECRNAYLNIRKNFLSLRVTEH